MTSNKLRKDQVEKENLKGLKKQKFNTVFPLWGLPAEEHLDGDDRKHSHWHESHKLTDKELE